MKTILSAVLICFAINCHGQTLLEKATQSFVNQEWEQSAKLLQTYLEDNSEDSAAWYGLGVSQMNLGLLNESIVSLKNAEKFEFNRNTIAYNLAKVYQKMGDQEKMYQILESAANDNGLANLTAITSDPDFSKLQKEDRFQAILSKIEKNAYPCLTSENARHFDFWLGEWDVFAGGTKAGVNIITRAIGGCAIHENYTTQGNYAGQSINFYSPVDQKWHQHWVGSAGDVFNYVETKRDDGLLQFQSEYLTGQGDVALSRLTFTLNADGTVRQFFENSNDNGETWTPAFDGLYKKRN
ncbi:MAG: hypothetical protein RIF33_12640 [Cyclobacteriaceae bacterium]